MESRIFDERGQLQIAAPRDVKSGDVLATPEGAGIVLPLNAGAAKEGMQIAVQTDGKAFCAAASADTFDAGDAVAWDDTAKEVVPLADADADFFLGLVVQDKASGTTEVLVDLNKHAAPSVGP